MRSRTSARQVSSGCHEQFHSVRLVGRRCPDWAQCHGDAAFQWHNRGHQRHPGRRPAAGEVRHFMAAIIPRRTHGRRADPEGCAPAVFAVLYEIARLFISGVVFALGLGISGMTRPVKVIGFLDFTGHWDPSLAFVMIGAITVYFVAYRLIRTCSEPVQTTKFSVSQRADIDPNLVVGAAVFGAGWGLGGFCPGPALASLASGAAPVVIFVAAMATGMYLQGMIARPNWWRIFARQPALAALRPLGDDS